jgi:hypothetical protein
VASSPVETPTKAAVTAFRWAMSTEIGIALSIRSNKTSAPFSSTTHAVTGTPIFLASARTLSTLSLAVNVFMLLSLLQKHDLPASDLARFT